MKVPEHLAKAQSPLASFEILPPLKGKSVQSIYQILDPLMEFNPPFINVTYHRSEFIYKKTEGGYFRKVTIRKRPGTVGICAAIMLKYKVDAVPHLTCGGFTIEETEDALIDLHFLGINNVLVIRGDSAKSEAHFIPEPGGHKFSIDLVRQIAKMNRGSYLEEELMNAYRTDFSIGVAGYPEKHFEAPNMQTDLRFLKEKVEAGAEYIVTQMFFDNEKFYSFVKACRDMGITVPIIPGLKPITKKRQIAMLPRIFHVDIPSDLYDAIEKCKDDEAVEKVGVEWCIQQSKDLLAFGSPCVHYYTMGQVDAITNIARAVF